MYISFNQGTLFFLELAIYLLKLQDKNICGFQKIHHLKTRHVIRALKNRAKVKKGTIKVKKGNQGEHKQILLASSLVNNCAANNKCELMSP